MRQSQPNVHSLADRQVTDVDLLYPYQLFLVVGFVCHFDASVQINIHSFVTIGQRLLTVRRLSHSSTSAWLKS